MKIWRGVSFALVLTILLLVVAANGVATGKAEQGSVRVLRIGNENAVISPITEGCNKLAELVEKKTGGQLKVTVFPAGQLGGGAELFQATSLGTLDMDASGINGQLADIVPEFAVLDAPGIFDSTDQYRRMFESPLVRAWREQLIQKANIRILGAKLLGTAYVTSNKPAYKPSDFNGLKMRAVPFPIYMEIAKALGGVPTPVAFTELFGALQQGIVDAQYNNLGAIYEQKFYEVQKYLLAIKYGIAHTYFLINENVYQSLTKEQQQALQAAADEACTFETKLTLDLEGEYLKKMKEYGNIIIGPSEGLQREAFIKSLAVAMGKYEGFPAGLYNQVIEAAKTYR